MVGVQSQDFAGLGGGMLQDSASGRGGGISWLAAEVGWYWCVKLLGEMTNEDDRFSLGTSQPYYTCLRQQLQGGL